MLYQKLAFENLQAKHIFQEVTAPGLVEWGLGKKKFGGKGEDSMSAVQWHHVQGVTGEIKGEKILHSP